MRQTELSERFDLALCGKAGSEWRAQAGPDVDTLVHSSGNTWLRERSSGDWKRAAPA